MRIPSTLIARATRGNFQCSEELKSLPLFSVISALVVGAPLIILGWLTMKTLKFIVTESAQFKKLSENNPRVVFFTWHRNNWIYCGLTLSAARFKFTRLIGNDKWISLAHGLAGALLGFRFFFFRLGSKNTRIDQIARYVKEGNSVMLLPDSGGPYGKIKRGLVKVALTSDALLVPVSFECDRKIVLGRTLRQWIMLPWTTIKVTVGDPIKVEKESKPGEIQSACERSLGPWS